MDLPSDPGGEPGRNAGRQKKERSGAGDIVPAVSLSSACYRTSLRTGLVLILFNQLNALRTFFIQLSYINFTLRIAGVTNIP